MVPKERRDMAEESLARDPLTGLPNYWYMLRELERHIAVYKRYRHPFSLVVLHLDNLKWVKDTYGDTTGDSALEYLGALIETHVRKVDISCRHAEDGFAIIMPETNKQAGQTVGRRISQWVHQTTFKVDEASVSVKVSYGTASCPRDGVEAETLLRAAANSNKLGMRLQS